MQFCPTPACERRANWPRAPENKPTVRRSAASARFREPTPLSKLIQSEIAHATASISSKAQQPGIHKIREQNAIPRLHLGAQFVHRMPGIIAYRKRVPRIRGKIHSPDSVETAVRQLLLEDGADVADGIVLRQIQLNRDPLPMRVGVFGNLIAWNVSREHRNGIEADVAKLGTKAAFQTWSESGDKCFLH